MNFPIERFYPNDAVYTHGVLTTHPLQFHGVVQVLIQDEWADFIRNTCQPFTLHYRREISPDLFTPEFIAARYSCALLEVVSSSDEAVQLVSQLQPLADVLHS